MTSLLTSPIPMIPITGWLPEPVDWVTVVAIFAATLLSFGDFKVCSVGLCSSIGRSTADSGIQVGRRYE